jgi:hypothetical protein
MKRSVRRTSHLGAMMFALALLVAAAVTILVWPA